LIVTSSVELADFFAIGRKFATIVDGKCEENGLFWVWAINKCERPVLGWYLELVVVNMDDVNSYLEVGNSEII
jgi:hypothetical protein